MHIRKYFIRIAVFFPLAILPACVSGDPEPEEEKEQQEGNEEIGPDGQGVIRINAALPSGGTKTVLGEPSGRTWPILWQEGDQISCGGVASFALDASSAGASQASFRFDGAITAPYNFICPASPEAGRVALPSTQHYVAGSYDPVAVPLIGSTWSLGSVNLGHTSAVLEIPVSGNGVKVRSISVMAAGGEPLCGDMVFSCGDDGRFDGGFSMEGGSSSITLDCGDNGAALSAEPLPFFVAIPSGAYKSGFYFLVKSTGGEVMRLEYAPSDYEIPAAGLIRFPSREFKANTDFVVISSEEDLMAFAEDHSKDMYLLAADLDMSGKDWTPFSFSKIFDGGGHTVKGLSSPMFTSVSGQVRNLTFDSSFTIAEGTSAGFFAGSISGTLENFKLKGKYTYNATSPATSSVYIGGIAGRASSATLYSCTSEAQLSVPSSVILCAEKGADASIGGLFGRVDASSVLKDCSHEGSMSVSPSNPGSYFSAGTNVGGVCGHLSASTSSGNYNKGTVYFGGSWQNSIRMGGVIGYLNGTSTFENDVNSGNVTAAPTKTATDKARYGGAGGVYGIVDNDGILISGAVCERGAVVSYIPDSSQPYSFAFGGVIGAVFKNAEIFGLVNRGEMNISGSETTLSSSRRGLFVGGIAGASVSSRFHDCSFDGSIEGIALNPIRNAFGGIVGQLGSTSPDEPASAALTNCYSSADSKILLKKLYNNKKLFVGGIVGSSRNCAANLSSCNSYGLIQHVGMLDSGTGALHENAFGGIVGRVITDSDAPEKTWSINKCTSTATILLKDAANSAGVCIGGIAAALELAGISIEECSGKNVVQVMGKTDNLRFGGIAGVISNRSASGFISPLQATLSRNTFSGTLKLEENGKVSACPIVGGIVGFVTGETEERQAVLEIQDCHSSGNLRRKTSGISSAISSKNSSESIAGGILGSAGLRRIWETEDVSGGEKVVSISVEVVSGGFVDVSVTDCTHGGFIYFNPNNGGEDPLTGNGNALEISPNFSISGGIVGMSAPRDGKLSVLRCSNSGKLFSTSGTSGGIIGYIYTNTSLLGQKTASGIEWVSNSGAIYERDRTIPVSKGCGTSYLISGGIVGAVNKSAANSRAEYCWNTGDIAGSGYEAVGAPVAGGIVGQCEKEEFFRYCKNSGYVRNYPRSGSADLGGYLSGGSQAADGHDAAFSDYAAGGYVARGGVWKAGPWDGTSKLPWEE